MIRREREGYASEHYQAQAGERIRVYAGEAHYLEISIPRQEPGRVWVRAVGPASVSCRPVVRFETRDSISMHLETIEGMPRR